MNTAELYNTNDRTIRSGKLRKRHEEQKRREQEAKRERIATLQECSVVNKRPEYRIPERNAGVNISKKPRHKPIADVVVDMSEEMIERERIALEEIERKKKCVAPAFNKGAYTYIASEEQAKWVGRK